MDSFSIWINNNQLIDLIGLNDLKDLQTDIIDAVFGGFKNMLRLLIKNYNKMSYEMNHKLYNTLLTKHDGGDIYDNYKNENSISIAKGADRLARVLGHSRSDRIWMAVG